MGRYECKICHGVCDPGELTGGVCQECQVETMERREKIDLEMRKDIGHLIQARYRKQADGQLAMELM